MTHPDDRVLFVLAGSYTQYDYWRRQRNLSEQQARYISSPEMLMGFRGARFVRIGTWFDRQDMGPIAANLRATGAEEVSPHDAS